MSGNYREYVHKNLELARTGEKKSDPKMSIVFFAAAALLLLNAVFLFAKGRGIMLAFMGPTVSGVISVVFGGLFAVMGVLFLSSALKNRKADVTEERMEKYLAMVRALGTEEEIFAKLESLPPKVLGGTELRYDSELIAATSTDSARTNFIYPLSALTEVKPFATGSLFYLSIQAMAGKKKEKYLISCTEDDAIAVTNAILEYRPALRSPES